ncbi:protein MIZU-KUSSEI 1-like [Primulina huaijiensis]|uniref:protein MIZU-KUSSEI 1-like n=1 Tax=Primulina huaijiensis TaxID=1492673 RepID=UPI003CC75A10
MNNEKISTKKHFQWTTKISNIEEKSDKSNVYSFFLQEPQKILKSSSKKHDQNDFTEVEAGKSCRPRRKKLQTSFAVSRLQAVLNSFIRIRASRRLVLGTLFGNKRGNAHLAFQKDAKSAPSLLVELATPITGLVREMGPGLVRIAFECDNRGRTSQASLLDEPAWRTYCNGNKLGFATRVECGEKEWKILKTVEPISMGAGVLGKEKEEEDAVIYMRVKFERVVGTANSEAFYMINPDNKTAPELSVYFLRA